MTEAISITLPKDLKRWASSEADKSGFSTSRFISRILEAERLRIGKPRKSKR